MKRLSGSFYRLIDAARAGEFLSPARSPEGRFHHGGQQAMYLSETPEGCHVAMAYYAQAGDPAQALAALELSNAMIIDLRDPAQCARLGIDPSNANNRWQNERAEGLSASTWVISDAARMAGADGMLSPSRSRPALTHLTLFSWNRPNGPELCVKNINNSPEQV
ncbi:MAG: RES domain-containing protein [Rhodobacteraceae bacterium]|nr:RES domain-containing protein [Paracoccaceae bacterium]